MITIPITTISTKNSFSNLIIFKNYLRTTIVQDRFSELAIMLIENGICENLDCDDLIVKFVEAKINFVWVLLLYFIFLFNCIIFFII